MDMASCNQNRILCTNLTELVKKTLLSFCEINITFSSHLEIFGSVHVHADGDDVISFLLNEKCARHVTGPKNVVHRRSWSDTMGVVKSQSVATEEFLDDTVTDNAACGKSDDDRVSSSASREYKGRSTPEVGTPGSGKSPRSESTDARESAAAEPDDDVEIVGAEMSDVHGGEVPTPTSGPMYSADVKATWQQQHGWARPTQLIPNWSAVSSQSASQLNGDAYAAMQEMAGRASDDRRRSRSSGSIEYVPPIVTLQEETQEQLISASEVNSVLRSLAGDADVRTSGSTELAASVSLLRSDMKQEPGDVQATYNAEAETTAAATHGAGTSQAVWGDAGDVSGLWQTAPDGGGGDTAATTVFKHPCFLCSLSFHSQLRLKMHLSRWHRQIVNSPGGEVRCLICHKVFPDSDAFSAHTDRCHYRCVACGKSFSSKQAHDLHFRADHQLVRYQCQICMVRFKTKDGFRCHMNAQHNRSRQYDCLTCGRRFYTRQALYSHKKQTHPVT